MAERYEIRFQCPRCLAAYGLAVPSLLGGGAWDGPVDSRDQVRPEPRRLPIEVMGEVSVTRDERGYRVRFHHRPCGFDGLAEQEGG